MKPTVFKASFAVIDLEDNTQVICEGHIRTFICPRCSNTHFELQIGEEMKVATAFSAEDADKIGHAFIAPCPVQPEELTEARDHLDFPQRRRHS